MIINKNLKLFASAIVGIVLFTACEKSSDASNVSVTYGTSFGMCNGYCIQSIQINASTITYSKSKHQAPDTKTCTRPTEQSLLNQLITLDEAAFNALPATIGCPDCADGGSEYIEVNRNGKKHRVTYEYGHAPEPVAKAVATLKPLLASFKDCN